MKQIILGICCLFTIMMMAQPASAYPASNGNPTFLKSSGCGSAGAITLALNGTTYTCQCPTGQFRNGPGHTTNGINDGSWCVSSCPQPGQTVNAEGYCGTLAACPYNQTRATPTSHCACPTGTHDTGTSCAPNFICTNGTANNTECVSCYAGFHLSGSTPNRRCVADFTCANGASSNGTSCTSCNSGYHLSGGQCVADAVPCTGGDASSGRCLCPTGATLTGGVRCLCNSNGQLPAGGSCGTTTSACTVPGETLLDSSKPYDHSTNPCGCRGAGKYRIPGTVAQGGACVPMTCTGGTVTGKDGTATCTCPTGTRFDGNHPNGTCTGGNTTPCIVPGETLADPAKPYSSTNTCGCRGAGMYRIPGTVSQGGACVPMVCTGGTVTGKDGTATCTCTNGATFDGNRPNGHCTGGTTNPCTPGETLADPTKPYSATNKCGCRGMHTGSVDKAVVSNPPNTTATKICVAINSCSGGTISAAPNNQNGRASCDCPGTEKAVYALGTIATGAIPAKGSCNAGGYVCVNGTSDGTRCTGCNTGYRLSNNFCVSNALPSQPCIDNDVNRTNVACNCNNTSGVAPGAVCGTLAPCTLNAVNSSAKACQCTPAGSASPSIVNPGGICGAVATTGCARGTIVGGVCTCNISAYPVLNAAGNACNETCIGGTPNAAGICTCATGTPVNGSCNSGNYVCQNGTSDGTKCTGCNTGYHKSSATGDFTCVADAATCTRGKMVDNNCTCPTAPNTVKKGNVCNRPCARGTPDDATGQCQCNFIPGFTIYNTTTGACNQPCQSGPTGGTLDTATGACKCTVPKMIANSAGRCTCPDGTSLITTTDMQGHQTYSCEPNGGGDPNGPGGGGGGGNPPPTCPADQHIGFNAGQYKCLCNIDRNPPNPDGSCTVEPCQGGTVIARQCSCPATKKKNSGGCECKVSGAINDCTACPVGQQLQSAYGDFNHDGKCAPIVCTGGHVLQGNDCVCPSGTHQGVGIEGDGCVPTVCANGSVPVGNTRGCGCPPHTYEWQPQVVSLEYGPYCTACGKDTGGNESCLCPAGSTYSPVVGCIGKPQCPAGYYFASDANWCIQGSGGGGR